MDRTDSIRDFKAAILAPFRERFGPNYLLGPTVLDMYGRGQQHPETGEPLCGRHELAERVAKVGQPVFSTLCERQDPRTGAVRLCPLHAACLKTGYLAQYRYRGPAIRLYTHEYLVLPRTRGVPRGDLVIVDESYVEALVGQTSFGLDRLTAFRRHPSDEDQADLLELSAKARDALLAGGALLAELRTRGISREDMERAAALEEGDGEEPLGVWPNTPDEVIARRLDADEASERQKRARLFHCLVRELKLPRDGCHGVDLRRDEPMYGERQDRVVTHYLHRLQVDVHVPVLLIDADAEINRRIWGAHTAHAAVPVEPKATVVQVYSARFSNASLIADHPSAAFKDKHAAERRREGIAALVRRKVVELGQGPVVASRKVRCAFTGEDPADKLPIAVEWQGATITHFGAVRGRDSYKGRAWAVIVGHEQPPPQAIEGLARAIWAADPEPLHLPGEYVEAPRGYRMRDGSERGLMAQVHPDPRVQRVLELKRERETVQAIDPVLCSRHTFGPPSTTWAERSGAWAVVPRGCAGGGRR